MKNHHHKLDKIRHERFEQLYSRYSGRVYNFVMKISRGNSYLAEEITQIVFMKVWEKLDTIDQSRRTTINYMFETARNTLLNYIKHEAVEYIYLNYLSDTTSDVDDSSQNKIDQSFLNEYVAKLMEEMPPVRRKIFTMSRVLYLSNKEIADELGISVSTVETHIGMALKFMREALKNRYGIKK